MLAYSAFPRHDRLKYTSPRVEVHVLLQSVYEVQGRYILRMRYYSASKGLDRARSSGVSSAQLTTEY
jgi:hypothetical protein